MTDSSKLRIMLVYSGHGVSTIDVCQGFHQALSDMGHTVRAYDYHNRLAFWMESLENWRKKTGADYSQSDLLRMASQQLVLDAMTFVPNVVVVVCGLVLHRIAFEMMHGLSLPVALILTESPYLDEHQRKIVTDGHVKATFTNDRSSLPYFEGSCGHLHYLPHSFDPLRHRPRKVGGEYRSDVFFMGTMYEEREELFKAVDWGKYHVVIKGAKLSSGQVEGAMHNDEVVRFYSGAKINLNMHRTSVGEREGESGKMELVRLTSPAHSLGPRTYEIAACGGFQICDDTRPELQEVFGDSVPVFHDAEELQDKVDWFMSHPTHRNQLRKLQQERVVSCTFRNRATEIVEPVLQEIAVRP